MVKIKLWEVRTAKGLKLEAVALLTGVSKSTLNNIENGKTSPNSKFLTYKKPPQAATRNGSRDTYKQRLISNQIAM